MVFHFLSLKVLEWSGILNETNCYWLISIKQTSTLFISHFFHIIKSAFPVFITFNCQ